MFFEAGYYCLKFLSNQQRVGLEGAGGGGGSGGDPWGLGGTLASAVIPRDTLRQAPPLAPQSCLLIGPLTSTTTPLLHHVKLLLDRLLLDPAAH